LCQLIASIAALPIPDDNDRLGAAEVDVFGARVDQPSELVREAAGPTDGAMFPTRIR
jgi:hypothetical protein